ncbi:MAG: outer membrane protein assembly factor BamD [Bacteroidota bacterium]
MYKFQIIIKQVLEGLFGILLIAGLAGCSGEEAIKQLSADQQFAIGMQKFHDEEYLDAIDAFKVITLQYQGSRFADAAQFYMGECRFLREEYVLAAFEYDLLIKNMPMSKYVINARFQKGTCYYALSPKSYLDQEYTKKAIDAYQAFLEYHPSDSLAVQADARIRELTHKLAEKDYENGVIYMKMEYYKASTYYFDLILDKYYDTEYAEPSFFKKIQSLYFRRRYSDATKELDNFVKKYPASSFIAEVPKLREDIKAGILLAEAEAKKLKKAFMNIPMQPGGSSRQ